MAKLATASETGHIQIIGRYSDVARDASFIPTTVITSKDIGPGPKLVYSWLLKFAATNEPPTNDRLAADLGISPRSVRNYIAALKATGLVEVHVRSGNQRSFKLATAL